jgi:predicted transcriptional regulator
VKPDRKRLSLSRPRELEALISPVRVEVVEQLQAGGPASVGEIAAALGRSPHSLYYHVRLLESVGIVKHRHTRRVGKRDESVYALAAERIEIQRAPWSPAKGAAFARAAAAILRRAERNMRAASADAATWASDREPRAMFGTRKTWLDRAALLEIATLVARLDQEMTKRPARGRPYLWTFALAPLVDRRRRRKP